VKNAKFLNKLGIIFLYTIKCYLPEKKKKKKKKKKKREKQKKKTTKT